MITASIHQHISPIGDIQTLEDEQTLYALAFSEHWNKLDSYISKHFRLTESATHSITAPLLERYFDGELSVFSDVKMHSLGTAFQQQVWQSLQAIPHGETWSYQQQANWLQKPSAVRAVAAGNGKNPISIFVPCHRVIGSNGKLTGYAGGLERKEWLLAHERKHAPS